MFATAPATHYHQMMKLYVITDIHDQPTAEQCLSARLAPGYDRTRLSLNALSGQPKLNGEALHRHLFMHGGIEETVRVLGQTLKDGAVGLGYSAGGTAIWRAAAAGSSFSAIFCVSSTRLRDEATIATPNFVFFGADDPGKPSPEWLATVPAHWTVFDAAPHDYYRHPESDAAQQTCTQIAQALT
ncbi:hypothetical protein JQW79_22290 [Sulfitobacter pseudonitzschiae]|uniref:hypothetical protein n=3 Tax=Pseudosulfitobacter pseudonitzschiae TaxID=1402135 RepID=UPI001CCA97B3|nr:hypothetical protein [Pseudosulfitobacter pseudonitzschiae]MBM1839670.1 hypothetical protein [Pseudosulfitobacter pseudonitzschiae]MBM1849356.1 hypothetical protein [Pseudosulfitobacter pseudonitzschiae]MBM1868773.1 hypothetical protein [Pseudosulfitobacter pseudonitzschiae]MBM1878408.1 hypothetical protein [Pseudosulfitobacter pseudonitzschiae]MBM1907619.1 hypothetical protein [Pseudosulfitobacter pseudonitzschiae]